MNSLRSAVCSLRANRGFTTLHGQYYLKRNKFLLKKKSELVLFRGKTTKSLLLIPRKITSCVPETSLHDNATDHLTQQIQNAKSVDKVLLTITNSTVHLEAHHLVVAISTLERLIYEQAALLPCAYYDNNMMLCVQCFTNSEMKELFKPVLQCPEFQGLISAIAKNSLNFTDKELVAALLSLTKLHVDQAHDTIRELLVESLNRQDDFSLENLAIYSEVGNHLKRAGFFVNCKIASIFQKRVEMGFGTDDFQYLSKILVNVGYFFTSDFLTGMEKPLANAIKDNPMAVDPSWVVDALEPIARFSNIKDTNLSEDFSKLIQMRVDELKMWQLPKVLVYMNMIGYQDEALKKAILWHASEFLSHCTTPRLADVVSLFAVCDLCNAPKTFREGLENILKNQVTDADTIILKVLAQNSTILNNRDILENFGDRVVEKMSDLKETLSCMLSVVTMLSKANPKWMNEKLISTISDHLVENIFTGMACSQPKHFAVFSRYLLQYFAWETNRSASTAFSHLMATMIPQMSVYDLMNIGTGLTRSKIYHPYGHPFYYLYATLTWHMLSNSEDITNVTMLNTTTQNIFMRSPTMVKESITPHLVELYRSFSQSIRLTDANQTAVQLRAMRLHVPEVLQRLADVLVESCISNIALNNMARVLEAISVLNYTPYNLDVIERLAVQLVHRDISREQCIEDVLMILASLSSLQVFPERTLNQVLSLEFLPRIDKLISQLSSEGNIKRAQKIANTLCELNRNVTFYCPQLGIPWFHMKSKESDRFYKYRIITLENLSI